MKLEARGLGVRYGELEVLAGLDLELASGAVTGIVGPSGCGKSTLLRCLGGLLEPDRGEVTFSGERPPACLNPFTFVFQDFALLPWRTVEGNVSLALEPHGLADDQRRARIDDVLRRTGLRDFAAVHPARLSGGMRQRVGLARALVVRPAVLLMDEPLSALDAQTRLLLQADLIAVWEREATTTAYVTHDLREAVALCDRIVVLGGRPAGVVDSLEVPIPRRDRRRGDPVLTELQEHLWSSLEAEARAAERRMAG